MEVIIQRRFINFVNSLQNSEVLITLANVAKYNPFSTFGCNYVNPLTNNINERYSNIMPEEKLDNIDTVRELIEVRDGRKVIVGLDRTELLDLLECLCTEYVTCILFFLFVFSCFSFFLWCYICFVPLLCK